MWLKWLWDAGRDSLIPGVNASDSSPQFLHLLTQTFYNQTHLRCHGAHLDGFSWTALHGARSIVFPPEFVEGTAFVFQVFVDFLCLVCRSTVSRKTMPFVEAAYDLLLLPRQAAGIHTISGVARLLWESCVLLDLHTASRVSLALLNSGSPTMDHGLL